MAIQMVSIRYHPHNAHDFCSWSLRKSGPPTIPVQVSSRGSVAGPLNVLVSVLWLCDHIQYGERTCEHYLRAAGRRLRDI
jgi:hypothetical protein